jgi:hypothetical protein
MGILFMILGIAFAVLLVLGIINKDDDVDLSYLEDC